MARGVVWLFQLFSRLYLLSRRRWFRFALAGLFLWWALDALVTLLTETQWQQSLGYGATWQRRITVQAVLFGITAGSVWLLGVLPLRVAASLPHVPFQVSPPYRAFVRSLRFFVRHSVSLSRLTVCITALWMGRNMALHWMDWLLFQYGDDWPGHDPQLGRSVGFFVFRLPGWHLLLDTAWKIVTVILLLTAVLAGAYSVLQLLARRAVAPSTAWRWTMLLAALWFALRAAGFYLAQFDLITQQHPDAAVPAGMNFTDWHVRRPLLWFAVLLNLLMMCAVLWFTAARFPSSESVRSNHRSLLWRGLLVSGLVVLLLPAALNLLVPGLVTRFIVSPDEASRENPFIRAHLRATRAAWQLNEIVSIDSNVLADQSTQHRAIADFDTATLRLWDVARLREALLFADPLPAQQQLSALDLDRYDVDGDTKLIGIAVREAGGAGAPRGWLNQHVQYSHGDGIVACDATTATADGQPVILRDLPQLALAEQRVFYGAAGQSYALSEECVTGGVLLDSPWQRCVWAWRLRDINLLLYRGAAGKTLRLLFRRTITERAMAIVPFLKIGGEPYPVVANGRLVWLLDLLTVTATYPAARANGGQPFNAARDSVKMVMDAADGRVTFYVASPGAASDPILKTWRRAVPKLVRPYEEMPTVIRRHRRYPQFLFGAQWRMLGRYHDESPQHFHAQRDVWSTGHEADQPDYALLPSWDNRKQTSRFVLQGSLMSGGGKRLAGLLRAGCDESNYGRLALLHCGAPANRPNGPAALESAVASRLMRRATATNRIGLHSEMGAVLTVPLRDVASRGRLLLFAPIYTVRGENRSDVKLRQVAVMDAMATDAQVGIDDNKRLALEQLGSKQQEAMSASDEAAGQIAALTAKALSLHNEAQAAAARDWQRAGKLWHQEREVLQQLSNLTRRRGSARAIKWDEGLSYGFDSRRN